jgi:hypothetical protein
MENMMEDTLGVECFVFQFFYFVRVVIYLLFKKCNFMVLKPPFFSTFFPQK